ncbi:MAG: bifunctional oligoribonuclease/PAP phosphatase NrnA [Clostridiales bacterium]|nr:bifunctional oligoribonuclease/PAP phosphatase NrnA [Clostridiales bacterium]
MHTRPDGDAIGSAYGLCGIFMAMGRDARCLCSDPIPKRLAFLNNEKLPCLEPETLSGYDYDGVISVDIGAWGQIGSVAEDLSSGIDIMIDHHSKGEPFADYYINKDAAAAGEIIYDIACEFVRRGRMEKIDKLTAACIYAAISSDTGCFKYSNVTAKTHQIAADLLALGVPFVEINRFLFDSKSRELLNAERIVYEKLRFYSGGSISICAIDNSIKRSNNLLDEHFSTAIDIARSVEGVKISMVIREMDQNPGSFRVSMRANEDIDVSDVCAHFGGGGHLRAAGCTIERDNIEEVILALLERMGVTSVVAEQ